MKSFTYNDMAFSLEQAAERWNILCQRADGKSAYVATGVFVGVPENEVEARALALVKASREVAAGRIDLGTAGAAPADPERGWRRLRTRMGMAPVFLSSTMP